MVFDITQIKKIRKQMGMTQHAFAREIGISQSMIAKLEAGRLDPTYSKVKQIEEGLLRMMKKDEKSAREIMTKKIIEIVQKNLNKSFCKPGFLCGLRA